MALKDVRRLITGTGYKAGGSIKPKPDVFKEQGSARGPRLPDVVPALTSRQSAIRVYDEMLNGDATVDISLRVAKVPILGASYFIQPFDDKPQSEEIAEFVSFNIFDGMTHSYMQALEDALRAFDFGFSILEMVWESREWAPRRTGANRRKYTMLRKLGSRPAPTIAEFVYDDAGGPVGVLHNAIRADGTSDEVKIPIDKLVIFTNNKMNGNLEGKSLLRTAHQPWFYKKELYKIDAIQKERHALGVPVINIEEAGYTTDDVKVALQMVQNIRTNEKLGGVLPPGFDLNFKNPAGAQVDVMPSIDHHDRQILLNVMAQFLLLGMQSGGGGGRATSGSHVDMFIKSLKYVAKGMICDSFNLYVIPKMVGYNYKTDEFPTMRVRNIGESKDVQMWASAWANLATAKLVTPDFDLEQYFREEMDAPYKKAAEYVQPEDGEGDPEQNGNRKGSVNPDNVRSGTGSTSTDPGFESAG